VQASIALSKTQVESKTTTQEESLPVKTKWNDSLSLRKPACYLLFLLLMPICTGGCFLILKSPPYKDPDQVVRVLKVNPESIEEPVSGIEYLEWRNQSKNLGPIAVYVLRDISLTEAEPERVQVGHVSADFFPLLGASPIFGRTFISDDYRLEAPKVAILSYDFWQRRFSGDSNIIGKTIKSDQESYTVVGVMPPEFKLPDEYAFWRPLALDDDSLGLKDSSFGLRVMARLKPDITFKQAQAEIDKIQRGLQEKYPTVGNGRNIKVTTLNDAKRLYQKPMLTIKVQRKPTP
jgi:putative ABC transport system permease protein